MSDTELFIESPCVDNCCLDDEDVCLGCFRSLEEIKQWNSLNSQERLIVLRNVSQRRKIKTSGRNNG